VDSSGRGWGERQKPSCVPDTQRLGTSSDLVTPSLALSGLAVPESVPSHLEPSHGLVSPLQNKDGSYTGFIKVQLKLVRPVSVPSSKKPPSLQDARRGPGRGTAVRRRTSFYLPKDAVKHLHVLSRTRAREVIEALLRKFLVVDDPRKFALFERAERHGQVYLRKLSDDEQPLRLRLLAGPNEKALSFVLKENDSGEVNWDAFSMPELHNFLRILQREEEEHLRQILQKYSYCRQKIQEALHACPLG
uniref:Ras association domain family member 1 n=1 Tax=Equus caballus TaxID=9796 RepID=F6SYL3_HORSE